MLKKTARKAAQNERAKINGNGTDKIIVNRNYKDTVFRMLFREKESLLSLYNALNRTSYTDINSLKITTLENALYMNYKNDISFVFDSELMLYEHQSTVNPNMPLRNLIYVTKVWQAIVREQSLYGEHLILIPAPQFVVFYNGTASQPEKQILRLSESYKKMQKQPELELVVTVYNINMGCNQDLLDSCHLLREYAQYVELVRTYARKQIFPEAVEKAVDYCIRNGILSDFLSKNRSEAIEVCIFEFDEEKFLKDEREYSFRKGQKEGENRFAQLLQNLIDADRSEEIARVISDSEYRERLYRENQLV